MSLPKLNTALHTLVLPSTGEEISFRPFLVREEKILMMAMESGETKDMINSLRQIIDSCVESKLDVKHLPMFDIEYIFIHLRKRSVGSKIDLQITCPDDNETRVTVSIDLDEVGVQMSVEHSMDVELTDDIAIKFRYPLLKDVDTLPDNIGDFERMLGLLYSCIETVTAGEEVHERIDMSNNEIEEFVESFNGEQLENVLKFFEDMPKLRHTINVVNPKTKVKSEVVLEGIESFLESPSVMTA